MTDFTDRLAALALRLERAINVSGISVERDLLREMIARCEQHDEERARLERAVADAALAESAIELPQYGTNAKYTPEREAVERAWSAAMDRYNEAVKALREHIAREEQEE
jgi:hypothetical protein